MCIKADKYQHDKYYKNTSATMTFDAEWICDRDWSQADSNWWSYESPNGASLLVYNEITGEWFMWVSDSAVTGEIFHVPTRDEFKQAGSAEAAAASANTYTITYGELSDEDKVRHCRSRFMTFVNNTPEDKLPPWRNPDDVYPVSEEGAINCSGKHGPHDLRVHGQKRLANGRLTCRACLRQSKQKQKAKRRAVPRVTAEQIKHLKSQRRILANRLSVLMGRQLDLMNQRLVGDHEYAVISQAEFDKRTQDLVKDRESIRRLDKRIEDAEKQKPQP